MFLFKAISPTQISSSNSKEYPKEIMSLVPIITLCFFPVWGQEVIAAVEEKQNAPIKKLFECR